MHIGLMHEKLKRTKKGGCKMLTLCQETKNCTTPKLGGTHPNLCSWPTIVRRLNKDKKRKTKGKFLKSMPLVENQWKSKRTM
jgi:hypothetical protein